jgi:hypothetical protein
MDGEPGSYMPSIPKTAAEVNADRDTDPDNGTGYTDGSYTWVVLSNGLAAAAYKAADGHWYVGFKDVYP